MCVCLCPGSAPPAPQSLWLFLVCDLLLMLCGFDECCSCLGPPPPAPQSPFSLFVLKLGCGVS